jgi:hypothetical protein
MTSAMFPLNDIGWSINKQDLGVQMSLIRVGLMPEFLTGFDNCKIKVYKLKYQKTHLKNFFDFVAIYKWLIDN